jgi:hypothetical protein
MAIATTSPIVSDREWNAHILAQLAGGKLTQEQALAQLKTAPKSNGGPLSCKQSEKGAVSVYGLLRRSGQVLAGTSDCRSRPALLRRTPCVCVGQGANGFQQHGVAGPQEYYGGIGEDQP